MVKVSCRVQGYMHSHTHAGGKTHEESKPVTVSIYDGVKERIFSQTRVFLPKWTEAEG